MTDSTSAVPQLSKPSNVQELVKAWRVSGRKAQVLETRLQQAVQVARRYRRDLLRLAEQNRSRKLQADGLQQKLLQLLEQRAPDSPSQPLPPLPEGDDTVPADYVRQLLVRLREAHDLVAEFETLLEFREKQVHELLSRHSQGAGGEDWRVVTLQRELTEARHRIRLLTQELTLQGPASDNGVSQHRVAELEQQLGALVAQGDVALQAQLQQREQQVTLLQEQLDTRVEELNKAVAIIHSARERIKTLEQEVEASQQVAAQDAELQLEVTNLQDEVARVQEENENLATRLSQSGDPVRGAKLEAAVVDLRGKLQLAASKYQEVKAALIEKHQQLLQLQSRSAEMEKSSEQIQHGGRTLEAALAESRKQNTLLLAQMEALRKAGPGAPAGEPSEEIASLNNKLKEARKIAIRAQGEAGQKRKDVAKLQEEVEQLKATVLQLGGSL